MGNLAWVPGVGAVLLGAEGAFEQPRAASRSAQASVEPDGLAEVRWSAFQPVCCMVNLAAVQAEAPNTNSGAAAGPKE